MHTFHWKVDTARTSHCGTLRILERLCWLDLLGGGQGVRGKLHFYFCYSALKYVYWRRNGLFCHQVHGIFFVFSSLFSSSVITLSHWQSALLVALTPLPSSVCMLHCASSLPLHWDLQSKHLSKKWQAKYCCRISSSLLSSFAWGDGWLPGMVIHASH